MKTVQHKRFPVSQLISNEVQPPWRVEGKMSMNSLVDSIRERGLLNPIFIASVKDKLLVIDGHRRLNAIKLLGHTTVTCRVVEAASEAEAGVLFAKIDGETLKMSGKDRLFGWAHSSDREAYLRALKQTQSALIRSFVKIFGETDAVALSRRGINPNIAAQTYALHRFLTAYLKGERVPPPLKSTGLWIINHRASNLVNVLINSGGSQDAGRLLTSIQTNKPFKLRKPAISKAA